MAIKETLNHIAAELKGHAKFTIFGALLGISFMLVFQTIGRPYAGTLFSIFHPSHVLLSAMVTASLFTLHRKAKNFILILVIGYVGSIGIATLSDSIIPYLGEKLLGLYVPSHADLHDHADAEHQNDDQNHNQRHKIHLGFIEDWYIVNPAAILGVIIAYLIPRTKFPHAGHVLVSTWASSSHILMNTAGDITIGVIAVIFVVLFIAVWVPCCISDIVFPLLFVKSDIELTAPCPIHELHSHPHLPEEAKDNREETR